jgi:hypothetical protein
MNDLALIRELLDPALTVGEAEAVAPRQQSRARMTAAESAMLPTGLVVISRGPPKDKGKD